MLVATRNANEDASVFELRDINHDLIEVIG
jgi:hypothetical protein